MIVIRCSSTDRILACSSSSLPATSPYNPNTPEANEGRAAHAALALIPLGQEPDIEQTAIDFHIDPDDLRFLVGRGRKAWGTLGRWFPTARTEYRMAAEIDPGRITLRGTSDVIAIYEVRPGLWRVVVLDWKAGWRPPEHPGQIMSYAYLGAQEAMHTQRGAHIEIVGIEVWLRLKKLEVHRWGFDDLEAHRKNLIAAVDEAGEQWGPSSAACQYCPHQNGCSARDEYIRAGAAAIEPMAENAPITRELIGKLWDKRTELYRALRRFDDVADAMLDEGPIDLGDGRQLERVAKVKDRLRPSKAMALLRDYYELTPDEADAALRLSKTSLSKVIKGRARKGRGASEVRRLMARLKNADAIETRTSFEKRVTRKGK